MKNAVVKKNYRVDDKIEENQFITVISTNILIKAILMMNETVLTEIPNMS